MAWMIYRVAIVLKETGERLRSGLLVRLGLALRDRALGRRVK